MHSYMSGTLSAEESRLCGLSARDPGLQPFIVVVPRKDLCFFIC